MNISEILKDSNFKLTQFRIEQNEFIAEKFIKENSQYGS